MNGALLLIFGVIFFIAAYRFYGRYLKRLFGIDPGRETPAHTSWDGVDYVPTKTPVLFGHHFASIAGAGPIVGPVLAAYLGWGPVVLWVLFGCVFVGAMHDFAAFFLSVRDGGRSIGHVIERQIGYWGRQIFLLFSWAALLLVVAIFAILVAKTFVATPAVATASLLFIGLAPIFGYLVSRGRLSVSRGTIIFVPLLFLSVWIGVRMPLDLGSLLGISAASASRVWLMLLFAYVFVASTIPVWLLLQPRDYLNSFLLYAMIFVGFVGILWAMPAFRMPAFVGWSAGKPGGGTGELFPILFVTVACGACSGFHALVASGTTAKQVENERVILPVGYGSMLVEGVVALMALISVAVLSREEYLAKLASMSPVNAFAGGLAGITTKLGLPLEMGKTFIALAISAFMLTTMDTATRLTRFAWQELFLPRFGEKPAPGKPAAAVLSNTYVATLVVVVLACWLAFGGNGAEIWPVFGASNQLLAALTLLTVTLYLIRRRANFWIALFPMLFMMTISGWALVELFRENLGKNYLLVGATAFLIVMAVVLAAQAVLSLRRVRGK